MPSAKRVIAAIASVAVALAAVAGVLAWRTMRPKPMEPPQRLTVANIGVYSVYNILAKEKGYFAANGLDAQVDEYDSGATSIAALLSGKADVAIAADFVGVVSMFKNSDLRILASVSNHQTFRVIARRDKGISSPADLKGRRIGFTKNTVGEYYLDRFLTANGISTNDIVPVDLGPALLTEQIDNGQLDAIIIFEPHAYAIEKNLGNRAVAWPAQRGLDTMAVVYSTQSFIERDPETVAKYLRSLLMADSFLKSDAAAARAIIAKALNYSPAYESYIWTKFNFAVALRQELLLRMEDQARFLIDKRMTDATKVPNYAAAIYFSALENEAPDNVTIIH